MPLRPDFSETLELGGQGPLGLVLQQRVERAEDHQARLGEVFFLVVAAQLAAHQVEKRRVVARALPAGLGDAERPRAGASGVVDRDHALRRQQLEHQVAALERALRVPARVVVGRPADDRDHERDLVKVQLRERLAEIELARETEAVHGALAVLPEVDLVDVGVHDVRLLEARLENDGHHRLLDLAAQRAPAVEEVVLDELLGQRAAALLDLARADVGEKRAQDRRQIDAVMLIELAVLDGLERLRKHRRHLVRRDDDAVLAVHGEDAADQERIEPVDRDVDALRIDERGDPVADERELAAGARAAARPRSETRARAPRRAGRGAGRCPADSAARTAR